MHVKGKTKYTNQERRVKGAEEAGENWRTTIAWHHQQEEIKWKICISDYEILSITSFVVGAYSYIDSVIVIPKMNNVTERNRTLYSRKQRDGVARSAGVERFSGAEIAAANCAGSVRLRPRFSGQLFVF